MVTSTDLIPLAFDPDLVQDGITVALRWLAGPGAQAATPGFPHMRARVAQICLDLAFRRYLSREGIPHRYLDHTPFSAPQHQDITLGGRRCVLVPSLVGRSNLIARIRQEVGVLLEFPLPEPAGTTGASYQPQDLIIFGFLLGAVTPSLRTLQKAMAAGRPVHLLHWLPPRWQHPRGQDGLGTLVLKNEGELPITLELAGRGDQRETVRQAVHLPPGELQLGVHFHSLVNLQARELAGGSLCIHSPFLEQTHRVRPIDWGNLWIYGERIMLAGYLSGDEYRQAVQQQRAAQRVQLPAGWPQVKALTVTVLKPLPDLFARVKAWGAA